MANDYMYRARILEYPEFEQYEAFDDKGLYGEATERRWQKWSRPVGWSASADYVEHFKTDKFFEPSTGRWYKSRSSVAERVKLLNSMGYKAIVQRSAPVVWPTGSQSKVEESGALDVGAAIHVLKRAGLIKSADDLFKGDAA